MDMYNEDFDIGRLKRFLWDSPNRIHNLIVTTLSILTLGMGATIGLAMAQPEGFVQSFSETFSNIMGPVVGGVAAVFALMAFYVQYKANQLIQDQSRFDQLDKQFSRYIDAIHKCSESYFMTEGTGKACLDYWAEEFKFIKAIVAEIMIENKRVKYLYVNKREVYDFIVNEIAFEVFVFGSAIELAIKDKLAKHFGGHEVDSLIEKIDDRIIEYINQYGNMVQFGSRSVEYVINDEEGNAVSYFISHVISCNIPRIQLLTAFELLDAVTIHVKLKMRLNSNELTFYRNMIVGEIYKDYTVMYRAYLSSSMGENMRARGLEKFLFPEGL